MQANQQISNGSSTVKNQPKAKNVQTATIQMSKPQMQMQMNGFSKPQITSVSENPSVLGFELSFSEEQELRDIVLKAVQPGKGFLAADDTNDAMGSRLKEVGLENSAENRRRYRQLLFTTPNIHKHISAVILYDDTFRQVSDNGQRFVDLLRRQNVQVAIQVDMGLESLVPPPSSPSSDEPFNCELVTRGLDDLNERIAEYKKGGCTIAKWYSGYRIYDNKTPSQLVIEHNAMLLARYAMICQRNGIVPIVETDVVCQGSHSLERCQEVSERVLTRVFKALAAHNVYLEGIILKTNMVTSGLSAPKKATPEQVAYATLSTLQRCVPSTVPMIGFLSGGLDAVTASQYLNAINQLAASSQPPKPWQLTFCYGRALQAGVLELWKGFSENVGAAQKAFMHRCRANSDAEKGQYENEVTVAAALASIVLPSNGLTTRYY